MSERHSSDDQAPGADSSWRPLYRAGAVAAGLAVVAYVAALAAYVATGEPSGSGGAAVLEHVNAHRTTYIIRQLLWLTPSLFLMVTFLAIAISLRLRDKNLALIAGTVSVASWAVSLASPTTGDGSLAMVRLSDRYADATTDAERAPFIASAETLIALNDTQVAIGVLQTLGILMISLLMLKGVFSSGLAWMGVATGITGIASESLRPVLGWAYSIYGILLFLWLIWIALALWRLGAESQRAVHAGSASVLRRRSPA
jgi:hypothetical protein